MGKAYAIIIFILLATTDRLTAQAVSFIYSGAVNTYTVPAGVTLIRITAAGAAGGGETAYGALGGQGAVMSGIFSVYPGEVFNVMAGKQGQSAISEGGGGGGTFVWDSRTDSLYIAAGGGGGAGQNDLLLSGTAGLDATTAIDGVNGMSMPGGGGISGGGATPPVGGVYDYAGGGAGWLSAGNAGTNPSSCIVAGGGSTPLTGGAGGTFGGLTGQVGGGGYGGGGGAQGRCAKVGGGGGGGYSGGGGGGELLLAEDNCTPGGGGGSINRGDSQVNNIGNTANGYVAINVACPPPTAGVIMGRSTVCSGDTISFADSAGSPGGFWSSSDTNIAVVTLIAGRLSGVSSGTSILTYEVDSVCGNVMATDTITILPYLVAGIIVAPVLVCAGIRYPVADTVPGGVWTCTDTSVAAMGKDTLYARAAGLATISYTLSNTCDTISAVYAFTVQPQPLPGTIEGANGLCVGDSMVLSDTLSGGSWLVTHLPNMDSIGTFYAMVPGMDTVLYVMTNNCGYDTASKIVTVLAVPNAGAINGAQKVCLNASVKLTDTVAGGAWWSTMAMAAAAGTTVHFTGVKTGIDTILYVVHNLYCADTASYFLTVDSLPPPGIIAGSPEICLGGVVVFSESIPGGWWSSQDTDIAQTDSLSGTISAISIGETNISYTVPPNSNGCTSTAVTEVKISSEFGEETFIRQVTCSGDSNGFISVAVTQVAGPFQFQWSTGSADSLIDSLIPGKYELIVTDLATRCISRDTFVITQPEPIAVNYSVRNETCEQNNGTIAVSVSGGTLPYAFRWSDNDFGNEIKGLSAGTYTLNMSDTNGCSWTGSFTIIDSTCTGIIVHDVITPNGDGLNDEWVIENIGNFPTNTVKVFDKWGTPVFEQTGYRSEWKGLDTKGEPLPDGTYFYLLKLNYPSIPDEKQTFSGSLLLKR